MFVVNMTIHTKFSQLSLIVVVRDLLISHLCPIALCREHMTKENT